MERVLPFERSIVSQDTGYWCGPATVQNILSSRMRVPEEQIAREMGTTQAGTNYVGLLRDALARRLPDARYTSVYLQQDPPTADQKAKLWLDIVRSIDNGYGVAMNWVSPPGNKPRGVKGSPTPRYSGGTTFHYVSCLGWSDEGNNGRPSVFIVDSGFWPNAYWIDFEQCATLIPPKGYAFADLPLVAPIGGDPAAPPPPVPPAPSPVPAAPAVVVPPTSAAAPARKIADPFTGALWSPNRYSPRKLGTPGWIVWHTQEGGRTARGLAEFLANPASQVSYHSVNDDVEVLKCVAESDAPWAAMNANQYAFHHCFAGSYAAWSRDKWLDPDASDGKNEDLQLTKGAAVGAWWSDKYGIPATWIGGGAQPPWGLRGHLGHVDLGQWGGGHHDPGGNFPVNEFMRRIREILTGVEQPPLVPLPPVVLPGTNPDRYADWMEYQGKVGANRDRVSAIQTAMNRPPTPFGLQVDGVFGPQTRQAVIGFQKYVGLVADGIVGPMTAAALKP